MILGTIYVIIDILDGDNNVSKDVIYLVKGIVSLGLSWLDMALKTFLYTLINKIRQLIKEDNEEPEDC
jgi:hypothetical protein